MSIDVRCVIPHYGGGAGPWVIDDLCLIDEGMLEIDVIDSNPPNPRRLFTEAVNVGVKKACRNRVIWILNNDTRIAYPQHAFDAALKVFDDDPHAGIVGSCMVRMDDPDLIHWGGSGQCWPAGRHKTGRISNGDLQERTEEEWVTFASVFIRADVFREIGMLDKNLRHICSDADFCLRAREAGWKCFYEPKSIVRHACGSSSGTSDPWLRNVMQQDVEHFTRKWITPADRFNALTQYKVGVRYEEPHRLLLRVDDQSRGPVDRWMERAHQSC